MPGHATHLVKLFQKEGAIDGGGSRGRSHPCQSIRFADGLRLGDTSRDDIRMISVYIQFEERRLVDKPGYKAAKGYPCERCN